jgi:hypothetical protein
VTFPDQAGEPGTAPTDLSIDGAERILFGVCAGQRNGPGRNLVVRVLPSGARDPSFGSDGLRQSNTCPEAIATGGHNQVFVLRPSDPEMIRGPVDAARTLEAWKQNGRMDSSFGKGGRVPPGPAGTVSMFAVWQDLTVDQGGHVVLIGELERPTKTGLVPNALIATRLSRRARPAPGFGPKGRIVTRFAGLKLIGEGALGLSRAGLPLGAVGLMGPEGRTSLAVLRYGAS